MNPILCGLICACFLSLAAPTDSYGKIILITRGDTISRLGDISAKVRPKELPANLQVGYKYSYVGVFWIDFFTYDGEYCLFEGMNYVPISKEDAAPMLGIPESDVSPPLWYRFPPGWLVFGAIVVIVIVVRVRNKRRERDVRALMDDPRYQRALDIFKEYVVAHEDAKKAAAEKNEPAPEPAHDPWNEAIAYLVSQGIDKAEADEKFGKVLALALAKSQQPTA